MIPHGQREATSPERAGETQKRSSRGPHLRDSVFISYAHKDQEWCDLFRNILCADRSIRVWTDHEIREGEEWDEAIQAEISTTRIALLLVSPGFLSSNYIATTELPQMINDARLEGLVVKWVLVEDVPRSLIPGDLLAIQGFKIWNENREEASLSAIKGSSLLKPTMSRVCEEILTEMSRFATIPRHALLESVRDALRGRRYTLREEITVGDHSVVYSATKPGGTAIVKALVQSPLQDWKGSFEEELQKARELRGDGFIPIDDWSLERYPKVIISEYQRDVQPLREVLQQFRSRDILIPIDRVRYVLQVLVESLAEYHESGLVFGNITPSDVLMERTPLGPSPRIPAYRFSQMVERWEREQPSGRKSRFTCKNLTYLAPEQFENDIVNQATDQYALGLLAIELLQSKPPVEVAQLCDLDLKKRFFKDPVRFAGRWKQRSPELTRVIAKMLARNPTERWPSMSDVLRELGKSSSLSAQNRSIAKRSYSRLRKRQDHFYQSFYENLFASKSSLKSLFKGDKNTLDWAAQYRALDSAICRLLNFSSEEADEEPTTLTETARRHRARFHLLPEDFDHFLDAFVKTLEDFDEGSEDLIQAWRSTITPGIDYMREHASRGSGTASS